MEFLTAAWVDPLLPAAKHITIEVILGESVNHFCTVVILCVPDVPLPFFLKELARFVIGSSPGVTMYSSQGISQMSRVKHGETAQ